VRELALTLHPTRGAISLLSNRVSGGPGAQSWLQPPGWPLGRLLAAGSGATNEALAAAQNQHRSSQGMAQLQGLVAALPPLLPSLQRLRLLYSSPAALQLAPFSQLACLQSLDLSGRWGWVGEVG
jgi:hypothetical protein